MITPADLLTPHGARELAQLATPEGVPLLDPELLAAVVRGEAVSDWEAEDVAHAQQALATIQAAADTANARINRVAGGRVLSADEQTTLRTYALDIARYRLEDDRALADEHPVRRRYVEATRFLERVASGLEPLGQTLAGTAGAPQADAPARTFTRDTLRGYG